jgi:gamma-glutamyltranspeptidase
VVVREWICTAESRRFFDAAHPNALSRKRPFHTIIPAFMERGDVHIGFGIMGGANRRWRMRSSSQTLSTTA